MKNIFISIVLSVFCLSCQQAGVTQTNLTGVEQDLPQELKGLKVYYVSTGNGGGVKVAILNEQVNSTTYQVGKTTQSTVILNKQNNKLIEVKQLLLENDSIIIFKK